MKLYTTNLNQLLTYIEKNTIRGLLLYGPDKGYISMICNNIEQKFDFLKVKMSYSGLKAQQLSMQLNARNFFSKRELIQIQEVQGIFDQSTKSVLTEEYTNFPIFIGDELTPSSAIRKFFESENHLAAIGCYHDEKNTNKLIADKFKNSKINHQAMQYLSQNLNGDYEYINNELEKLLLYAEANKGQEITLKDVLAVISADILSNGEDMCALFALKNLDQFLAAAKKFITQVGFNEIVVIRSLLRFYINIYIVNSKINLEESMENAIKTLSPPIFFKTLDAFKEAARATSISEAVRIIHLLQLAEKDFKSSSEAFDFFTKIYLPIHIEK